MKLFICETCKFTSKLKSDYNRHLKTKKHSENTKDSLQPMVMSTNEHKMSTNEHKMSTNNHTFKCDFCDLFFSTKPNKRRHELHYCNINPSIKDDKIKQLEKEKKKLERQITKMMNKACTINNNTTNNNNNTNNIIVVNNYGKENTDYLSVETLSKLLNRPFDSIQDLIKMLHFNAEHPENHNVKITNKKEQYAMVWVNKIWEVRKKKALIKDMVDKSYMMIDDTYDNIDMPNKKYINFQNQYDGDDNTIKEIIEEETELVIINESKKLET